MSTCILYVRHRGQLYRDVESTEKYSIYYIYIGFDGTTKKSNPT